MKDNFFQTEDIKLAAYLVSEEIRLVEIKAVSLRQSCFYFQQPPQKLLNEWLSGNANTNASKVINCYRHLVRDAKLAQDRLLQGGEV